VKYTSYWLQVGAIGRKVQKRDAIGCQERVASSIMDGRVVKEQHTVWGLLVPLASRPLDAKSRHQVLQEQAPVRCSQTPSVIAAHSGHVAEDATVSALRHRRAGPRDRLRVPVPPPHTVTVQTSFIFLVDLPTVRVRFVHRDDRHRSHAPPQAGVRTTSHGARLLEEPQHALSGEPHETEVAVHGRQPAAHARPKAARVVPDALQQRRVRKEQSLGPLSHNHEQRVHEALFQPAGVSMQVTALGIAPDSPVMALVATPLLENGLFYTSDPLNDLARHTVGYHADCAETHVSWKHGVPASPHRPPHHAQRPWPRRSTTQCPATVATNERRPVSRRRLDSPNKSALGLEGSPRNEDERRQSRRAHTQTPAAGLRRQEREYHCRPGAVSSKTSAAGRRRPKDKSRLRAVARGSTRLGSRR